MFSFLFFVNMSAMCDLIIITRICPILAIIKSVPFAPRQINIKPEVVVLRKRITCFKVNINCFASTFLSFMCTWKAFCLPNCTYLQLDGKTVILNVLIFNCFSDSLVAEGLCSCALLSKPGIG